MDEHRRRVDAAINAATLGELRELLEDLQIADPLPQPSAPKRPRRTVAIAVAGGLIVLAAAIGWAVSRDADSPAPTPAAAVPETPAAPPAITKGPAVPVDDVPPVVLNLPRHMDTVEGMTGLLDEIRKRFGGTMGYELAFDPERAYLLVPDPADEARKVLYTYRGGWDSPSSRPRSDTDQLVDLAAFDIPAAIAAWKAAPQTLGIAPDAVEDTYLDVDHIGGPGGGPGALEILIRVSTTAGTNGYVYLDPAGTVLRVENPS